MCTEGSQTSGKGMEQEQRLATFHTWAYLSVLITGTWNTDLGHRPGPWRSLLSCPVCIQTSQAGGGWPGTRGRARAMSWMSSGAAPSASGQVHPPASPPHTHTHCLPGEPGRQGTFPGRNLGLQLGSSRVPYGAQELRRGVRRRIRRGLQTKHRAPRKVQVRPKHPKHPRR